MSVTVILTVLLPSMSSGRKSSSSITSVEVMEMPSTSWNYKKIILMIKTRNCEPILTSNTPPPPYVHTFKKCHHLTESCWHQITTKKECHKVSCLFSKRIQRDYWKSNSLHLKGTCAVNAWIFFLTYPACCYTWWCKLLLSHVSFPVQATYFNAIIHFKVHLSIVPK